jgi:KEOPS complex subunit Cgi121
MELLEGRVDVDDVEAFLARLEAVASEHETTVQAFDADYVAGRRHLERAVTLADRAIERGENVARERAVEILLYAAGRRQIDGALEMGVSPGDNRVVILVDGGDETGTVAALRQEIRPEPTLDADAVETLCSFFDVPEAERAATDADLEALVCERVALLAVNR